MFQTRPEAPTLEPGKMSGNVIKLSCRNLAGHERDIHIGLDETVRSLQVQVQKMGLSESIDPRLVLVSRVPKPLDPDVPLSALVDLSESRQIVVMEPAPPAPKPQYRDEVESPITKELILKATEHLEAYQVPDASGPRRRHPIPSSALTQLSGIMGELRRLAKTVQDALQEGSDNPKDMETEADETEEDPFAVDPEALVQLLDMGFPENRSRKALYLTESDLMGALEYLDSHENDPTIDDPIEAPPKTDGTFKVNPAHFQQLKDMGFPPEPAAAALQLTHNTLNAAVDLLFNVDHKEILAMKERNNQQITKDSPVMKEILSEGRVQASLADPRALAAFDSMIANPHSAAGWLQDPLVGPILIQISQVLQRMSSGDE